MDRVASVNAHASSPAADAFTAREQETRRHTEISETFSIFLDHVRWISALLVVIGHIRQLFFVDYADVAHKSGAWSAFYTVSRIQHQAVLLFFLMSGTVIAGRFMVWSGWQRFDLRKYAIARLSRLWLVLVPVMILCLVQLAVTPMRYLPAGCATDPGTVLGNLFFVQEIIVPAMCNNIPLWSLANEFWYYTIMGLLVFAVVRPGAGRWIALVALAAGVTMIALNDGWNDKAVLPYFAFWLLGAAALHPRLPSPPILPALIVFAIVLVGIRLLKINFYLADWIFALATFQLLLAARRARAGSWFASVMARSAWLARPLAGQSYSLYLVHFPIVTATMSVFLAMGGVGRSQPGTTGLGIMAFIIFCSYGAAQIFYWLFESRTGTVKAWVERRIGEGTR